jgi:hypothetical protein
MYTPENNYVVYCNECYASDNWNSLDYGKDFNFSQPFFEQLGELFKKIPRRALYQDFAVDSEYTNQSNNNKDCYMLVTSDRCEKCMYGNWNQKSFMCSDCSMIEKSEFCYECINITKCSRCAWAYDCSDCVNVNFSSDCQIQLLLQKRNS